MNGHEAVLLLFQRFPSIRDQIDNPNELLDEPHFCYGLLASEALDKSGQAQFIEETCAFIDELANSGDELLEELLVVDVIEGIAQDLQLTNQIRLNIGPKAAKILRHVEKDVFKRP